MGLETNEFLRKPDDERARFHILKFEPELDMSMGPIIKQRFEQAAAGNVSLYVLDFSGVAYLDSTIIAHLVAFRELMEQRGAIVRVLCIGRKEHLNRLFMITGLDRYFTIYATVESALA